MLTELKKIVVFDGIHLSILIYVCFIILYK